MELRATTGSLGVIVFMLAVIALTAMISACGSPSETPSPPRAVSSQLGMVGDTLLGDSFTVIERWMSNDALYISLESSEDLSDVEDNRLLQAASEVARANPGDSMIRVFFYDVPDTPPRGDAQVCYQWTDEEGIVLNFDLRGGGESYRVEAENAARESTSDEPQLPEYTVLDTVALITGGKHGDILIPTYSRDTSVDILEATANKIARDGGFTSLSMYMTEDAYRADMSASFSNEHPGALENGFLGRYENGQFYPPQ